LWALAQDISTKVKLPNGRLNLNRKSNELRARKAENQASSPVHHRSTPKDQGVFSLSLSSVTALKLYLYSFPNGTAEVLV
jgi:hypothetical protein